MNTAPALYSQVAAALNTADPVVVVEGVLGFRGRVFLNILYLHHIFLQHNTQG